MFTMVIVDDEQTVVNHLVSNFDWVRYGVEVVGSADSGQKAYELILSKKPDINLFITHKKSTNTVYALSL